MRILLAALFVLASAQLGHCDTFDAAPLNMRDAIDKASTAVVAATLASDLLLVLRENPSRRWTVAGCEALKYGAVNGLAIGLKSLFPRERPNGLNNQDSFSEHTANVTVTAGPWWVDVIMGTLVAYLRGASNMHDAVGVLEGFGLGVGTRLGIRAIPACHGLS